jgi:uncharacterized protein YbjQ (UPF0145 family)
MKIPFTKAHGAKNDFFEPGANAVIGARYHATGIMQGVTEVLAYGAAVVVEAEL